MVFHLKYCIRCVDLRTGSIILGVLALIYPTAELLCSIADILDPDEAVEELQVKRLRKQDRYLPGGVKWSEPTEKQKILYQWSYRFVVFMKSFTILCSVLAIIMDILLIVGATTRSPRLVRAWVWYTSCIFGVNFLIEVITFIIVLVTKAPFSIDSVYRLLIGFLVVYCLLVVNSFHTELITGETHVVEEKPLPVKKKPKTQDPQPSASYLMDSVYSKPC